jgi:glyoxylase-like metal-dependent hydrolase (beta-lactamase superfamily II)
VLFHQADARAAWVGDTLFNGGVGRWDLPGGDFELLQRSIRGQIYSLPDDTIIFPGHGPQTTVGTEKQTNPYIAADGGT